MQLCASSIAFLLLAVTPPPPDARPAGQPQGASQLKSAIDALWKDGEIASDAEYLKLSQQPVDDAPTPRDMRRMLLDWPQPRNLRRGLKQLDVSFEHERLTLSWWSEFGCGLEAAAARDRFTAELKQRGYRPLDKAELAAWQKEAGPQATEWEGVYLRKSGGSELIVCFYASPYTGSSTYITGVRYRWEVRRPYRAPPPKLSEALAVLPSWMKAKHLGDKFYAALAEQPVNLLSAGRGVEIGFAQPITDKLVALEQNGFAYYRESSPSRDGTLQKTWHRYSDETYAHVLTSADGKSLQFSCQEPQHVGEPAHRASAELHPSLKLPPEKRPILMFDQLTFADGELERRTKLFHELAWQRGKKGWHVEGYKDGRNSADPSYRASFGTSELKSGYTAKIRPFEGMTISLQGKHSDGVDRLNSLYANGVVVPRSGWAASVTYNATSARLERPSLGAIAVLANEGELVTFDYGWDGRRLVLTQQFVSVIVKESDQFHYHFHAQLGEADFARSLQMLSGTPEELRDEVLTDLAALCKVAREKVESGDTTSVYDMSNVRSDNPPRQEPGSTRPASAAVKQAMLDQVDKQLADREALLREHFREIHAAVQQALPIAKLQKELKVE